MLAEATLIVSILDELVTLPDPLSEEMVSLDPPRFSVAPLLTVTEGRLVRRLLPLSRNVPLLIVSTEAPEVPLKVEDPPTVMVPSPRLALTRPPLS